MSRVSDDLIDGEARLSSDGDTIRRVLQVTELSGPPSARLVNAVLASGVPRVGDPHPVRPTARVVDVTARPGGDSSVALVDVTYRTAVAGAAGAYGSWQVDLVQSFVTEVTTTNINGTPLRTTYSFPTTTYDAGTTQARTVTSSSTRRHRVEVQRPTVTLRFTREQASLPLAFAKRFYGHVNGDAFQGEPSDRWLCSIASAGQGNGLVRVTYEFAYNASGWQPQLTFTDGGVIPDGVTKTNGIETELVYPRASFAQLGLPAV